MVSLDPQVLCGLVAFRQKTHTPSLSLSNTHTHTHTVPKGFAGNVNRTSLFSEAGASLCFVRAGKSGNAEMCFFESAETLNVSQT